MGVKRIFVVLWNKKQEACIMRLYKKAAAVLLAAAMAVSMMTACGGDGGGGTGSGSGGSGDSTTITVPDATDVDLGNIGKGDADKEEDAPTLTPIVSTQSMSHAYMQKVQNANEKYAELLINQYDADNVLVTTTSEVADSKGNWSYLAMSMNYTSGGESKNFKGKYVIEKATDGKTYQYTTFDGGKYAIKATGGLNGENIFDTDASDLPNNMYTTTVKINNKEYYAETYTETKTVKNSSGNSNTVLVDNVVCFDSPVNGNVVYGITKYRTPVDGVSMVIIAIKTIRYNSKGLCQLKQGCTVYTEIPGTSVPGMKLKDANGNIFIVGGDETLIVTDANNQDVTPQFQWLTKRDLT